MLVCATGQSTRPDRTLESSCWASSQFANRPVEENSWTQYRLLHARLFEWRDGGRGQFQSRAVIGNVVHGTIRAINTSLFPCRTHWLISGDDSQKLPAVRQT